MPISPGENVHTYMAERLQSLDTEARALKEREEAGRLRHEWVMFIGNRNPVLLELNAQQGIEPHVEALKQRMVTYLAGFSHLESSQA